MTIITKEGAERWWAAVQKHADTLDALIAMTIALGLTLSVEVIEPGGDK